MGLRHFSNVRITEYITLVCELDWFKAKPLPRFTGLPRFASRSLFAVNDMGVREWPDLKGLRGSAFAVIQILLSWMSASGLEAGFLLRMSFMDE